MALDNQSMHKLHVHNRSRSTSSVIAPSLQTSSEHLISPTRNSSDDRLYAHYPVPCLNYSSCAFQHLLVTRSENHHPCTVSAVFKISQQQRCQNPSSILKPLALPYCFNTNGSKGTVNRACNIHSEEIDSNQKYIKKGSPRKSLSPKKSADRVDQEFQGASISWKVCLEGKQPNITIDSQVTIKKKVMQNYHKRFRSVGPICSCSHVGSSGTGTGTSESRSEYTSSSSECATKLSSKCRKLKHLSAQLCCRMCKQCASCQTKKTPLWRDAEDGTPLCNACGIRYRKYRVHCTRCWYVPRKENKSFPRCPNCNKLLRY